MFEYIEIKFVIISIVIVVILLPTLVVIHVKSKDIPELKVPKYFLFILIITAIAIPFYIADATHETTLQNTKLFNDGAAMKCFGGFTPFFVSKENGWNIRRDSFVKKDYVVDMSRCFMLDYKTKEK